ncbi:hypothetical protein BH10PSE1_BH10PSE1_28220 [soil metagenome]
MIVTISMLLAMQSAPVSGDLDAAVLALRDCMDREVAALEPSGEAAPVVADAARTSCVTSRETVEARARSTGSTVTEGKTFADSIMPIVDEEMRSRAVLRVTRARATGHRPYASPAVHSGAHPAD